MVSLSQFWINFNLWAQKIPNKALDTAYKSAETIKKIEQQNFQGKMISSESEGGLSVYEYYKSDLDRELAIINFNLIQLRISNFFQLGKTSSTTNDNTSSTPNIDAEIREKLNFIESVISKYRQAQEEKIIALQQTPTNQSLTSPEFSSQENSNLLDNLETRLGKNLSARKRRFSQEYEQEVIQELRQLREKRKITWRILLLLIIVPLVVQLVTKNLVYSPIINSLQVDKVPMSKIRITEELGERYLEEYRRYRDILEIKQIFNPELYSEANRQEKLKDKAKELLLEAGYKTQEGLANILADITALLSFTAIVYFRKRQCKIALSFLNDSFLGLNVITQVFIFILLTDMFVGFHSAEGWDIILTTTFGHFGFSENSAFNGLFIATIPVMLDSIFKLLIFNYFTRKSPTAVAVLEKMNQ